MEHFRQSILKLVIDASTNLPPDVRRAIEQAKVAEAMGSRSALALDAIVENILAAESDEAPICQDTGMPTFEIHTPVGSNQIKMAEDIREAVAEATRLGKLRTNSVDPLTGKNSGDNLGPGTPVIHFKQWEQDEIEVKLILKGGGCENKNIQYSLPVDIPGLGHAGRDLDGVRKCLLHAVYQAQGQGCSAGFIGVCIGGDRTTGYQMAKEQLFRPVDDMNPVEDLAELEAYIMKHANELGIGTMGFGGKASLLGCKIGLQNRLPASFFVSVAYNCWAFRRQGVRLSAQDGAIQSWMYKDEAVALTQTDSKTWLKEHAIILRAPISEEDIRALKVGDVVMVEGALHTGRDALHKYLMTHESPVDLHGGVLYHCGPVMLKDDHDQWQVHGAGPTTSSREEPYQADIIKKFGLRAIMGKGGMGEQTGAALQQFGAVYLNAIGGAAQYYARCITAVEGVDLLETFGIPEAMWHLQVEGFPAIVTMDAHGNSLHAEIDGLSRRKLEDFAAPVFL